MLRWQKKRCRERKKKKKKDMKTGERVPRQRLDFMYQVSWAGNVSTDSPFVGGGGGFLYS